ncbi:DNA-binding transcriptional regulator, MarR family [Fodinibius salinus]|uniref:DNA-binding transcriptional regulator, MarR family n=1 Tax=Fodinibius salinus TaxID=860790 RepID=A0A5D3YIP7_9BACT|nr:MarR family transcriptional regulator [Fodinibius salinus]TYP93442.1 DNA-binding transcriptional regulator, MarR family [Fodinibius salinus]
MTDQSDSILDENIFFLAGALARKLSSEAEDQFARFGLSVSHALILMLVDQHPDIQPSMLAQKLYLKPSTISRLVQKLEQRELVQRSSEGRKSLIVCTTKGSERAKEIGGQWEQLKENKKEVLGERYMEVLSEMISNALEKIES